MFGFISKWKKDVLAGFEAIHQRIITLEAKVEALFNHTKVVAAEKVADAKDAVAGVVDKVEQAKTVVEDVKKTVDDVKGD